MRGEADMGTAGSNKNEYPGRVNTALSSQNKQGLYVRMFSAFSMEYEGAPIRMNRRGTKVEQIFARLLVSGGKGVPKRELIDIIYGQNQEAGADLNQYVNNLIYRLKKRLSLWKMDGASVTLDNGICRFEAPFPVVIDAVVFQQQVERALRMSGPERLKILADMTELYSGEFLEEFCTELWVIQKDHELRQLYFRACEVLGEAYRKSGNLYQARDVYHRAALLFPFDSWQLSEMDCLIALKDYDAAYAVYQETKHIYEEDLGTEPGEEYTRRLAVIETRSMRPARRLSDILMLLKNECKAGALYCYYTDFLRLCQILARIAERGGQTLFLLLCTWNPGTWGGKTRPADSGLEDRQMDLLKEVIGRVFRREDIYTRYGSRQYLILLCGTDREGGILAFDCLRRAWSRQKGAGGGLSYSMEPLPGPEEA